VPANRKTSNSKQRTGKKAAAKPKTARTPQRLAKPSLKNVVVDALSDMKALEVKLLDVRGLTDITDFMVIASGTSDRHVRSAAQRVVEKAKEAGFRPHGVEGQQDGDWVLIDLSEMIVHVMLPRVREFYGLEKLWDMTAAKRAARA
jgi:ribosome-associated protein